MQTLPVPEPKPGRLTSEGASDRRLRLPLRAQATVFDGRLDLANDPTVTQDRAMNALPDSRFATSPRIGDIERDLTCDELAKHYSAGRLSEDEMQERMSRAIDARTAADLYGLLSDLPRPNPRPEAIPALVPAQPRGRAIDAFIGFISISAAICLVLLFLATSLSYPPAALLVFLGGLGGSVAVLGAWHFSRGITVTRRCTCPHCHR